MNDAQADEFMRIAEQKFGRAALDAAAKPLQRLNSFRLAIDIESGRISADQAILFSPEIRAAEPQIRALAALVQPGSNASQVQIEQARDAVVNALQNTSTYVPTTGDPSQGFEQDVLGSGFKTPNVARDRRLMGRTESIADNGISASLSGMQRSAAAAGWNPFTRLIAQAYYQMNDAQRNEAGMRRVSITILDRLSDNIIINGDEGFSINNGAELEALRKENVDDRSGILRIAQAPTQAFAYAATQLNPTFGPINMGRDIWERSENLRTKELKTASNTRVNVDKAAKRMIGSAYTVWKDLVATIWTGKRTRYGDLLREFEALGGGGSRYSASLSQERADLVRDIERVRSRPVQAFKAIGKVVDNWNSVFENVSALAAYAALREQGMTKEGAAAAALDLMNFRKSGSAMPIARALYAFAQPAVTGGANLVNMLKTKTGQKRAMGYMVGFAVLQMLMGGLAGEDEELGKNKIDLLSNYAKDRFIPIPLGGDTIAKLPLGFGLPTLTNSIVRRVLGYVDGNLTMGEAITESLTAGVLPTFSPIEPTKVKASDDPFVWLAQTFAPTVLRPGVNVAVNKNGLGGQIVREQYLDPTKYKSEQGAPLTAEDYKDIAKGVRTTFGFDLAPEQVRELLRGFAVGGLRHALNAYIENPNRELMGRPTETPVLGTFMANYKANALIGEFSKFEDRGRDLLREKNANPDAQFDFAEIRTLELYESWVEQEKQFRNRSRQLTQAGVEKGVNDQRAQLRQERDAAQSNMIKQYNELR